MSNPITSLEFERLIQLSNYDLDYTDLEGQFKDLTHLAAEIAGTDVALINLVDSLTQWRIAAKGMPPGQISRDDAICQYTIMEDSLFEVEDLRNDDRFKDKIYVREEPFLKYYFGIPLKNSEGFSLGTLVVMDKKTMKLTAEQVRLIRIIGEEIVNRLNIIGSMHELKSKMMEMREAQRRFAHDMRGPIGGIKGMADVIKTTGRKKSIEEIIEMVELIYKSSEMLMDLSDEIMNSEITSESYVKNSKMNMTLIELRNKLTDMYEVQATNKNIQFAVLVTGENIHDPFQKSKLIHLIGNLISNAIKYSRENGRVRVYLNYLKSEAGRLLHVKVIDDGLGMNAQKLQEILYGSSESNEGTIGERGYGFGLKVVKHLLEKMHGTMDIDSVRGGGTHFDLKIPFK